MKSRNGEMQKTNFFPFTEAKIGEKLEDNQGNVTTHKHDSSST